MIKNAGNIKLIAFGFFLFYGITMLTFLQLLDHPLFGNFFWVLPALFIGLFTGSWGVLRWQEWGRRIVVVLNTVLLVYVAVLWHRNHETVLLTYLFIGIVTALFYSQRRIKAYFQPVSKIGLKSVLIVDDDEGLIRTVQKVLLPNGYSVLTATTGEKGLQIAKLQRPDLIILDVLLPGIKGREVCLVLKEEALTKKIPVLFLTAKDSPDDIAAEISVGAEAHLTKPVNAKTLLAEVRRIIG